MTSTLSRPVETPWGDNGLRLDPAARRRRPALALGSLALLVVSIAVFVGVYAEAGGQRSVLVLAHAVPQGAVLQASDLMGVRISTSSDVATLATTDEAAVVGRRAAESLEPGTLLASSDLVASYSPPAGDCIVGVSLRDGQFPASGVTQGETVEVVLTGVPGGSVTGGTGGTGFGPEPSGSPGSVLAPDATVLDEVPSPSTAGDVDVSLLTPFELAPLVANASAEDQVALVAVDPGP